MSQGISGDAIRSFVGGGTVLSEQVVETIKEYANRFVKELVQQSSSISHAEAKSVVDSNDLRSAVEKVDLARVLGTSTDSAEVHKVSTPPVKSPLATSLPKFPLYNSDDDNVPVERNTKSLYQLNGHSSEVQEWIKLHNGSKPMVCCLGTALIFKRIVDAIRETCSQPELNFCCGPNGIQVQAVGPSHVSLLSLELRASGFDYYSCALPVQLGINVASLHGFLKQVVKNDQITILYVPESRECTFYVEDGTRSSVFTMKLKVMDSQSFQITEGNFASHWIMPTAALQRVCRDLKACVNNDNVQIITTKDQKLSFVGTGRCGKFKITCDESMAKLVTMNRPCDVLFSHPYLNSFAKASPLSSHLVLKVGEDSPLMCGFEIENVGFLHFYLAPKVKEASTSPR